MAKIENSTSIHMCAFNQTDKKEIFVGLKGKFLDDEILTGREFCELLDINYDEIINKRREDAIQNFDYFIKELLRIEEVRTAILAHLTQ